MADPSQFSEATLLRPKDIIAQAKAVTKVENFKNKLEQLAQKAGVSLPGYKVQNEGLIHAPCFRATVEINGNSYTTTDVFKHRKEAEQEAARLALGKIEELFKKDPEPRDVEQALYLLLNYTDQLTTSPKSIFREFAIKEGADLPDLLEYCTVPAYGRTQSFVSITKYKKVAYPAGLGRSKKEAEQLAACAAIHQNLLGDAKSAATLLSMIKSKAKHFSAVHGEDLASHTLFGINSIGASTINLEKMADLPVAQASSENVLANHGLKSSIEFVSASGEQKALTHQGRGGAITENGAKKRARSV